MIVEALLANIVILLGLALVLWVIAVQIDDVSFVDGYFEESAMAAEYAADDESYSERPSPSGVRGDIMTREDR